MESKASSIKNLSFEAALQELEQIIQAMENGTIELKEAIGNFEKGVLLQKHCAKLLKEAEMKVEQVMRSEEEVTFKEVEIK